MKKVIILLALVFYSCDRDAGIRIQFVETTTKSGECFDHGIKEITTSTVNTYLSEDEFTIGLKLNSKTGDYVAMKRISCRLELCSVSKIDGILVITELFIVDQYSEPETFKTTDEIIKFMATGKYDLLSKENAKGNPKYIFQKSSL